jgi:hypothetical protein
MFVEGTESVHTSIDFFKKHDTNHNAAATTTDVGAGAGDGAGVGAEKGGGQGPFRTMQSLLGPYHSRWWCVAPISCRLMEPKLVCLAFFDAEVDTTLGSAGVVPAWVQTTI